MQGRVEKPLSWALGTESLVECFEVTKNLPLPSITELAPQPLRQNCYSYRDYCAVEEETESREVKGLSQDDTASNW